MYSCQFVVLVVAEAVTQVVAQASSAVPVSSGGCGGGGGGGGSSREVLEATDTLYPGTDDTLHGHRR